MFAFRAVFWVTIVCFAYAKKNSELSSGYCLSNDRNPYLYFGTKTSYEVTRGTAGSDTVCKPIQFWSLNRHGTRYPSPAAIEEFKLATVLQKQILDNYATDESSIVRSLCVEDFLALSNWIWDERMEGQGYNLTTKGWEELGEIARRFQKRYPHLLTGYSEDQFLFRHTKEHRTWASCRAYIEGLFSSYESIKIEEPKDDESIRPYHMCQAWIKNIHDNPDFRNEEKEIFRQQDDYKQLLSEVSKRLGFEKNLNHSSIGIMYDLCRYEKSWEPDQISPWCSVFTKPELLLLEYYEDLGQFYKNGFSHEYNPKLGCLTLQDMMRTFNKTVAETEAKPRVISLFSHDTLINMVFTALRFGKDDKLLDGKDYADFMVNRKFRSSLNIPFAGNIVAVLHQCSAGDYEVQFFVNERPMELDGCRKGLCSWEYLKDFLNATADCNLDFCNE